MRRRFRRPLLCFGLFVAIFVAAVAFGGTIRLYSNLDNIILVQAKVIAVKSEDATDRTVQLEISHVYCGSQELRARTFLIINRNLSSDSNGMGIYPVLEPGESAIWCLREYEGKLIPIQSPHFGGMWPAREKLTERYAEYTIFAESIEHAAQELPENRAKLFKTFTLDKTPEVSAWAIHALSEEPGIDNQSFLRQLAEDKQLGLIGQVALDEVLSSLDKTAWTNSASRRAMLQNWLSGTANRHEASSALGRFELLIQRNEIDSQLVFGLLKTAVANDSLPMDYRIAAVHLIGRTGMQTQNSEEAFNSLKEHIKSGRSLETQIAAVYAIKNFIKLDKMHAASLRNIRGKITDKRITDALDKALEIEPKK
jgi:hypothetical protein